MPFRLAQSAKKASSLGKNDINLGWTKWIGRFWLMCVMHVLIIKLLVTFVRHVCLTMVLFVAFFGIYEFILSIFLCKCRACCHQNSSSILLYLSFFFLCFLSPILVFVPFISSFPFLSAVEFALSCVTNWICIQNSS